MSVTKAKARRPGSIGLDQLSYNDFDTVSAIGAAVATTTVQAYHPMLVACKVMLVAVSYSAINIADGSHQFNIAVGNGAYSTGNATNATQTLTAVVVSANTGSVLNIIVNNATVVSYPTVAGDTTATALAGHLVTALNASTVTDPTTGLPFNRVYFASNTAGVITISQVNPGATLSIVQGHSNGSGNATTISTSVSTGATNYTLTAGGATFTGGVSNTGITTPTNDSYDTTNTFQLAATGQALFKNDMGIGGGSISAGNTAVVWRPDGWDAIIPQGAILTLRVRTPASTGSITNLKVTLGLVPYDIKPASPADLVFAGVGHPFDPLYDL